MSSLSKAAAHRVLALVLCSLCAAGAVRAADPVPPAQFADPQRRARLLAALPDVEATMARRFEDSGAPGMAYAVVIDGDVVLARGLGLADVARQTPVTEHTAFRIASMTKSFTALAVLKLRDAGRLTLDDPVSRHVPELRRWAAVSGDAGPITLRHLLAHTAGLPEDNPQGDRQLALTAAQFSAWIASPVPLARAPGSGFEYSNLGYMILGRVIGNVSGRPYQQYIRDEILRPLGMHNSTFSAAAVTEGRLALGYRKQDKDFVPEPLLADGEGGAMGGLITTPPDLARYVAAMLGAWPPRDGAEAPPALRRTLREAQTGQGWPDLWQARRVPGGTTHTEALSYGHGLQAALHCRFGRVVDHSGGLPGFGSHMIWLPDHGVGVVTMGNLTYTAADGAAVLERLQATGALQPREPVAAPLLQQAARAAGELVLDWQDARAHALAADNLFLDTPLAQRRDAAVKARDGLGQCTVAALKAENPLRGRQRLACEQGWIDIDLTLAPVAGSPRVQALDISTGRPLQPALQQGVDAVLAAMAGGAQAIDLAPGSDRSSIAAQLESTRLAHGRCQVAEVLDGDGRTQTRVKLACDRGGVQMNLTLAQGRLSKLSLRSERGAVCLP